MTNKTHYFICVVLILLVLIIGIQLKLYLRFFKLLSNFKLKPQTYTSENQIELKQDTFELQNIITVNQHPNYPTGCESISLYILLKYYNIDVTIEEIIKELPKGESPINRNKKIYAGNPEREFLGNPENIYSLGVYNFPIAKTANKFKKGAIAKDGLELEELRKIIKSGRPIIVWTSIEENYSPSQYTIYWRDNKTNEPLKWKKGEHAVVLYGYDKENLYISNPNNGQKYKISNDIFEYNYEKFGKKVVYYE